MLVPSDGVGYLVQVFLNGFCDNGGKWTSQFLEVLELSHALSMVLKSGVAHEKVTTFT